MRSTFLILAGLGLAACAGVDRSPGYTVLDSAGITIVENKPAIMTQTEVWSLAADPEVNISGDGEPVPHLRQVTALAPLPGKRLVVLDQGAHEVLLFHQEGELLARFGREGDGPGEFRQLASVLPLPGDSVGIYDSALRMFSVFDARGTLGRSVSLEEAVQGRFRSVLLPLPSEEMVLFTVSGPGMGFRDGVFRARTESLRMGPDGDKRASYGSFPGAEVFGGLQGAGLALFGATTYATTLGCRLVVGTGEAPEITLFDTTGTLERIVRWPDHDRTITTRHEEELFEAALVAEPQVPRATIRDILSRAPRAARLPPYEGMVGSDDGHVWMGSYQGPRYSLRGHRPPRREWLVFDTLGVLTAKVDTPEGFQPYQVAGSQVWGTFTHEDETQSVQAYTLLRNGG